MAPSVPGHSLAIVAAVSPRIVETGDVILFRLPTDRRVKVLHRVVAVVNRSAGTFFQTQGDANSTPESVLIPDDDVLGKLSFHVPRLGLLSSVLAPPRGFLVLLAPPVIVLLFALTRRRN